MCTILKKTMNYWPKSPTTAKSVNERKKKNDEDLKRHIRLITEQVEAAFSQERQETWVGIPAKTQARAHSEADRAIAWKKHGMDPPKGPRRDVYGNTIGPTNYC